MFNDKYGLTQAVLDGIKTQTRRIIPLTDVDREYLDSAFDWDLRESVIIDRYARYKEGEEVAVAQSYKDAGIDPFFLLIPFGDGVNAMDCAGWNNKMYVCADLMPHRIKITNIRIERLQDISEEDCLKEGFAKINVNNGMGNMLNMSHHWKFILTYEDKLGRSLHLGGRDHKEAFGILIDSTCGKGTWESNPYVFVYEFKLTK